MSQILLLTKNTLNEQSIEQGLLQLGHEVFITTSVIEDLLLDKITSDFMRMFQLVLLSETIDHSEVRELLKKMTRFPVKILRKSSDQLEETEQREWETLGIVDWITLNPTIETLREKVSCKKTVKAGKIVPMPTTSEKIPLSKFSLSAGEQKLFSILYHQQNDLLSRTEICAQLWERKPSNSALSQLSVMVKNLKDKLAKQNVEGPIIQTCWGKGYRLDESIYDQISLHSPANVM